MDSMFTYTAPIALAAGQRTNFFLNIDADSDFLIEKVYSNEDSPFLLQALDTTSSYQWFSDRIRMENFFGTAEYPNTLPVPILAKRSTLIQFDIENLDGVNPNNIELAFEGYRMDAEQPISKRKYYAYVKNFSIPATSRIPDTLITNSDADFIVNRYIGYRNVEVAYNIQLKISLSSLSARNLFSQYTLMENIFGTVLRPNNLTHPLPLVKNTIIKYDLQNNSVAAGTVQLVMDGAKVWS